MAQRVYSKYLSKSETRDKILFSHLANQFSDNVFLCLYVFMDKEIRGEKKKGTGTEISLCNKTFKLKAASRLALLN